MIDYSFLRLKDNFRDAKRIGDSPVTEIPYFDCIQLSPNESYLQITNVNGGISFQNDFEVYLVDCNDIGLKDITNKVYTEEFTDENGDNQIAIEIVNIGSDFYRETVYLRFKSLVSDVVYYSNPFNVTDYQIEQTSYFEYKNYTDFEGIGYTNSGKYQSIRLKTYFDIPIDESEVSDYYQISRQKTISARTLIKRFEQYTLEEVNRFVYERLNVVLKHDIIYLDCVRVTNKTTIESSERLGLSNLMTTNYVVAKDYNDTKEYEYQIYEGFDAIEFVPLGNFTVTSVTDNDMHIKLNQEFVINQGTVRVYDASDNTLLNSFDESQMTDEGFNRLGIADFINNFTPSLGNYYVLIDAGLISSAVTGEFYQGISDPTIWTFSIVDGDYSDDDYRSNDYLTN